DNNLIENLLNDNVNIEKNNIIKNFEYITYQGKRYLYKKTELPSENGSVVGYGQDITLLDELYQEIRYHKAAQTDILESSSNAMAMFDQNKTLKFYNQAFINLWKIDEQWIEYNPKYGDFLEYLRENRRLPEQTDFLSFKKEQLSWFTDLTEPYNEFMHLPDGKAIRLIAIPHALGGLIFAYEDMTDQLKIKRSYNTLIAVQRATINNLQEALVVFAESGKMELYNPKFAQTWNLSEEFLQKYPHINEVFEKCKPLYQYDEEWQEFKDDSINKILYKNYGPLIIHRTDTKVLFTICVALPDGGVLLTYADVTAQHMVEQSLRQRNDALVDADRLKTEFLANVSYELRSPLTTILGFAEILSHKYFGELNKKQIEYVEGIYQSSQYLMSLINDTLDLSSIEAGYMSLNVSEFNLYECLSSIITLVKERISDNNQEFHFECDENIGIMHGDERRIKQLVFKLLSNAIKFTEEGGYIELNAKNAEKDNMIIISVIDNGIGIDPQEQKIVFDKFYKTEASKNYNRSGAGLGLSVVKNFVELHGGYIELTSLSGKGTEIKCYIPKE
ncbi:MAG: ATP-binding protein, partial [Pseudomonadota bacterium]